MTAGTEPNTRRAARTWARHLLGLCVVFAALVSASSASAEEHKINFDDLHDLGFLDRQYFDEHGVDFGPTGLDIGPRAQTELVQGGEGIAIYPDCCEPWQIEAEFRDPRLSPRRVVVPQRQIGMAVAAAGCRGCPETPDDAIELEAFDRLGRSIDHTSVTPERYGEFVWLVVHDPAQRITRVVVSSAERFAMDEFYFERDSVDPTVTIRTPAVGAVYLVDQDVRADYACDDPGESDVRSCVGRIVGGPQVSDGARLPTAAAGTYTLQVTARDRAGNETPATRTYTVAPVPPLPVATIATPAPGATYSVGAVVPAAYACVDPSGASVPSCVGTVPVGSAIDTATAGTKTFTVTAVARGRQTVATSTYVVEPVTVTATIVVSAPLPGGTYVQDAPVRAEFGCRNAVSCVGSVASGALLDTSTLGSKSFTVTATDTRGVTSVERVTYTVVAGFRGARGLPFTPFPLTAVPFVALGETFGAEAAAVEFRPCGTLATGKGCAPVRQATASASALAGLVDHALKGQGTSFGLAMLGARAPSAAPLGGSGATGPSAALAAAIRRAQLSQTSAEFLRAYADATAAARSRSAGALRADLATRLAGDRTPLILVRSGWRSHAVVAHAIEDGPRPGGFAIRVWDPTLPYLAAEAGDPALHREREARSRVVVSPDGTWSFAGQAADWSGGSEALLVLDPDVIADGAPAPPWASRGVALIAAQDTDIAQVRDAAGNVLLTGDGLPTADPRRWPTGVVPFVPSTGPTSNVAPMLLANADARVTTTVRGTGRPGTLHAFRPGGVDSVSAPRGLRLSDAVTFDFGADLMRFRTPGGKPRPGRLCYIRTRLLKKPFGSGHALAKICVSPVGDGTIGPSEGAGATASGGGPSVEYVNESGGSQTVTATFESLTPEGFGTFVADSVVLGPGGKVDFRAIDYRRLEAARMRAFVRAQKRGTTLGRALRNQLGLRINFTLRRLRAVQAPRRVVRFMLPIKYRAPRAAVARVVWSIRGIGPRGRLVTRLTGRRLLRLDRLRWELVLPREGRFTVRTRIAVIVSGRQPGTRVESRSRTFRVRSGGTR